MLKQYWEVKSRYPDKDTILFFRLGDFYEMFFDDAEVASKILDIALTSRNKGDENAVPLCGIPFHSADGYIAKLLGSGKKVAICEQIEDPALAKGIVKRDVIRVITPGTVTEPDNLEAKRNNFLAAINYFLDGCHFQKDRHPQKDCHPREGGDPEQVNALDPRFRGDDRHLNGNDTPKWGFALIDVTTGLFKAAEFTNLKELNDELSRLEPSEIIVNRSAAEGAAFEQSNRYLKGIALTVLDDPKFDPGALKKVLSDADIINIPDAAKAAAGAIINYVEYAAKEVLNHIKGIDVYETGRFMIVDESTKRNLELTRTMIDGSRYGSLLWLMDHTVTPMGARLLREWLLQPLTDEKGINERLDAVEVLVSDRILSEDITRMLERVSDLERISGRIAMETSGARELIALKNSLKVLPQLINLKRDYNDSSACHSRPPLSRRVNSSGNPVITRKDLKGLLREILDELDPLEEVTGRIEATLIEEAPLSLKDGGLINDGASNELDDLRKISREGKGFIARIEEDERKRTGISSLKVRYNRVFGYYIEVTHTHKDKVPENYIRKQTLTNAERFITPELKEFEEKVLGAEEKIKALEYEIFAALRHELTRYVPRIKKTAALLARLDALLSLADVASKNRYSRPNVDASNEIEIKDGRHPVIEKINTAERFVPNDTFLNNTGSRLLIITGPNMAGKSTVMRQVALIVLMAQMGSFVPAASAKVGVVDRIFTRVGASDNIMRGLSTFMVEMQEASSILREATDKSLIVIDEIGRGTSTFDGLAIAWAVAEYIHDSIKAKTLFATHYHELTDLELTKKGVKNFNIAVKEWNDQIIFLHKIVPGGVNHSYGIQVAQLAGLPKPVVERAREVLANLETGELDEVGLPKLAYSKMEKKNSNQLHLFHAATSVIAPARRSLGEGGSPEGARQSSSCPACQQLKAANIEVMTPIEALNLLHKLKAGI